MTPEPVSYRRWVAMAGRLLHVLQLRAVLKRRGDEGRAHRVCRVAARKADLGGIFAHHAVTYITLTLYKGVRQLY